MELTFKNPNDATEKQTAPPSALSSLWASVAHYRYVLLGLAGVVVVGGVCLALLLQAPYTAHASVIVTLGSEYGINADAGGTVSGAPNFLQKEVVKTESSILHNADLARAVVSTIGIQTLYPELVDGADGFAAWLRSMGRMLSSSHAEKRSADELRIEEARALFDANLAVEFARDSSVINLSFKHEDPQLAARVLHEFIAAYFHLRREIYFRPQAEFVASEVETLSKQANQAENDLLEFKRSHDIADLAKRRELLLQQQSAAEQDLTTTRAAVAQADASVRSLDATLQTMPHQITETDTATDLRMAPQNITNDALENRLSQLMTTYQSDSPVVRNLQRQIAARKLYVSSLNQNQAPSTQRTITNPVWLAASTNVINARKDFEAAQAHEGIVETRLQGIAQEIRDIEAPEAELIRLERQSQALRQGFADASRTLTERRVLDAVQARKQDSVRLLESPVAPSKKDPLRIMIVLGAVASSGILTLLIGMMLHYTRSTYLTSSELEYDLGVGVLARVTGPYAPISPIS